MDDAVYGRLPPPHARSARPAAPVHRDASARVRLRARTSITRIPTRSSRSRPRPTVDRSPSEAFGDEAVWLDYQRPGLRHVAAGSLELLDAHPAARAVLLDKHGLVTWGRPLEETYRSTHRVRHARCRGGLSGGPAGRSRRRASRSRSRRPSASLSSRRASCAPRLAPRRCRRRRARGRPEPRCVAFASSARAPEVSQVGAPCPDHLIHTKHRPLVVAFDPAHRRPRRSRAPLSDAVSRSTQRWYREYYARHLYRRDPRRSRSTRWPRVILIPGSAFVTSGCDAVTRGSRATSTTARSRSQDAADALGGFRSL